MKKLTYLTTFLLTKFVIADLPVRCKLPPSHYVGSVWTVHVAQFYKDPSESKISTNIYEDNNICGHRRPNLI